MCLGLLPRPAQARLLLFTEQACLFPTTNLAICRERACPFRKMLQNGVQDAAYLWIISSPIAPSEPEAA